MATTAAVIGLGNMGGPMAANLVDGGVEVTGFDLSPAALEAARAKGVTISDSPRAAVAGADVVITMLPNGALVREVYAGADGILSACAPGTLLIDCSTIAVADALAVHQLAAAAGHRQVDAPVSGGVVGAEAGTLTFMVGASTPDFEDAKPILEHMGARIAHCGHPGLGQAAKICNNLILGISMIAVSEAFVLGESLGLSHQALFDVASTSSGQCWALTSNCPVPGPLPTSPANRDYRPGFSGALMAKDLGLAMAAFDDSGAHSELGSRASEMFRAFASGPGGQLDFSAIIQAIRTEAPAASG